MIRSHRVARMVGGAAFCLATTTVGAPAAEAADSTAGPATSPEPAAAQMVPPVSGTVGGSAGLYAVAGGMVVVAGGAATWLRRKRADRVATD
ncbi:hypothetical protein [Kitasatospora sp. KL5]|uniref:hypothetical protein n=1 Tax=Kitasatospora sp. KL5 TaxID=3425125 RepID=UPI003D6E3A73